MFKKLSNLELSMLELKMFYAALTGVREAYFMEERTAAAGIDALAYLSNSLERTIEGCSEAFQAVWDEWGEMKDLIETNEARKTA